MEEGSRRCDGILEKPTHNKEAQCGEDIADMDGAKDGYARFHDRRSIIHSRVNKVGEVQTHRCSIRNMTFATNSSLLETGTISFEAFRFIICVEAVYFLLPCYCLWLIV